MCSISQDDLIISIVKMPVPHIPDLLETHDIQIPSDNEHGGEIQIMVVFRSIISKTDEKACRRKVS